MPKILLAFLLLVCCYVNKETNKSTNQFITIKNRQFVDPQGRQVILHGINLVNKNKKKNYLGDETVYDFAAMKEWGFNCIRLGIIWDGLEPEPGVYDDEYLKGIDQRIAWAKANDIYIILDMHQDLFSVKYSDGAPEWATLSESKPHVNEGGIWSDAYFDSPAVQTAWDNFWNDSPAADGVGIQDHYATAWKHVAERYANDTTVIGYDLMNEPFLGHEAYQILPTMVKKGLEVFAALDGAQIKSAEELEEQLANDEGRFEILKRLCDKENYSNIIDATYPIYSRFERSKLMLMYQRVTHAIRDVDENHIIFLETTMGSNMGVYSSIEPVNCKDKTRDPLQAYAPHGYDLVTDTKFVATPCSERIQLIFDRHGETADKLNMPMLVGEWGAYGNHKETLPAARQIVQHFEKLLCSDTYWDFSKTVHKTDHFKALNRPYPQRICGTLKEYHFDPETEIFTCSWIEDKDLISPTVIYIPAWLKADSGNINLFPQAGGYELTTVTETSQSSLLMIPPSKDGGERKLNFTMVENKLQ
jgi:endoglycosylceramidase